MEQTSEIKAHKTTIGPDDWHDISNEAFRIYHYAATYERPAYDLRVNEPHKLNVTKKTGGDRHRLIIADPVTSAGERGMYITPGWVGITWQGKDGGHGITF